MFYQKELKVKDADTRQDLIAKSKKLPELKDVISFMDKNRKKLNLK